MEEVKEKKSYTKYEEYPSVLDVADIQAILGVGRVQAYELIKSEQFHSVRIGKRIKVSKEVFINWLEGKTQFNEESN